jgi:radical SAM superfamily enzyme YgiQ (UPF0313 family)
VAEKVKILFVSPPDIHAEGFDIATARRRRYLNYPPYGLGLLAAIAEEKGHEAQILNLQSAVLRDALLGSASFDAAWQAELYGRAPDLIALTCMFSQTHKSLQRISEYLAQIYPGVPQIAGGVHVTNSIQQPETKARFLSDLPHIGRFMLYEAEQEFAAYLDGRKMLQGRLQPTPEDLNRRPAWHLMDPSESSKWGKVGAFYFMLENPVTATVLSNRGCRAHCTFCSVRNFNGEGVRRRNVDSVVDELMMLQERYGVEHVMWLDDDFLFDRRETMHLFNEMVRRGWKGTWDCSNGVIAASCSRELLAAAVESGCIGLILGMESGNPSILKDIRKPGTVRHFLQAAENLRSFQSIHSRVFLMIGFPNETLRQIKDTLDVAREMDLDWYNIAPLQALPNTPIYRAAKPADDPTNIRFNSGAYSRAVEKARGGRELLSTDFKHAFDDLDRVPTLEELDSIWAYMNYHLNYARLEHEVRPVKLRMQQKYVEHICDAIAPDNAFAMHFSRVISRKLGEPIQPKQTERLQRVLQDPYWRARFEDFHLEAA